MNSQITYERAKQNWRDAATTKEAVSAAHDCVSALDLFAKEQEAGATKWIAMADEYCIEQGRLCNVTAANARRHAEAFRRWADEASRRFTPGDQGERARRAVEWKLED